VSRKTNLSPEFLGKNYSYGTSFQSCVHVNSDRQMLFLSVSIQIPYPAIYSMPFIHSVHLYKVPTYLHFSSTVSTKTIYLQCSSVHGINQSTVPVCLEYVSIFCYNTPTVTIYFRSSSVSLVSKILHSKSSACLILNKDIERISN
jgi:hypothetical protein